MLMHDYLYMFTGAYIPVCIAMYVYPCSGTIESSYPYAYTCSAMATHLLLLLLLSTTIKAMWSSYKEAQDALAAVHL